MSAFVTRDTTTQSVNNPLSSRPGGPTVADETADDIDAELGEGGLDD